MKIPLAPARSAIAAVVAGVTSFGLVLSSCGSAPKPAAASNKIVGTANVAYAGSLQLLNDKVIGPGFVKATGASYQGRGAGADGLSKEIAAGEIFPNVFESIGASPIAALEPRFTRWYVQLAASPIVVAYSPTSRYAPELEAVANGKRPLADLFTLMATPGFLIGRTNPDTDPQGQAFYEMVELAQSYLHLPTGEAARILGPLANPSEVFSETALESRLEAGQLDAASAFLSQAVQLHLHYITLPSAIDFGDPSLSATYAKATLTLDTGEKVHGAPLVVDVTTIGRTDASAADAFVAYLVSPAGRAAFRSGGYQLIAPAGFGDLGAAPEKVRRGLGA